MGGYDPHSKRARIRAYRKARKKFTHARTSTMTLYEFIQQLSYMTGRFEYQNQRSSAGLDIPWEEWKEMYIAWLEDQPTHERQDKTIPYTSDSGKDAPCDCSDDPVEGMEAILRKQGIPT